MVAVTYLERLSSSAIEVKEEETERTCLTCETKFALHSGCCCSLADVVISSFFVGRFSFGTRIKSMASDTGLCFVVIVLPSNRV